MTEKTSRATGDVVAVLAVQGAFVKHERRLEELGARCIELRQANDLERPFDRLVLPGGESTAQAKMLHELGMFAALRARIAAGMPTLATCAGLILLAERLEDDPTVHFSTLPIAVRRNAYGRQLGSFHAQGTLVADVVDVYADGSYASSIPLTFIRAPRITALHTSVLPLVTLDNGEVVAVRYKNQIACAFHPELDPDPRIHELFLHL